MLRAGLGRTVMSKMDIPSRQSQSIQGGPREEAGGGSDAVATVHGEERCFVGTQVA